MHTALRKQIMLQKQKSNFKALFPPSNETIYVTVYRTMLLAGDIFILMYLLFC